MQLLSRYKTALFKSARYIQKGFISKKPVAAYVCGWLGKQNLGDEALFIAVKRLFNRFNLLHFDGSRVQKILSNCFPIYKTGILAGGTIIYKHGSLLKIPEEYFKICQSLFVFGTGVANPSFWRGKSSWINTMDKWKQLLVKCEYVGVRGPISAELLSDAGIKNVEIVGDPVLIFAESEIWNSYTPNSIGLNIGQSKGEVWGDESEICSEFIKLANLAKRAGWEVNWFVVWPEDFEITQKAAAISETHENIYQIYNDPIKYIGLVRQLSTFVGMKLHAVVLSTCAFVPSVMLEYRPKCRDYMRSIGQDEATIRTDRFKAESVWNEVCFWNSKRYEKSKKLFEGIKPLQYKQQQKAKELMKKIKT